jgi:type II restriction enzyme
MNEKSANKGEWSELLAFAVIARDAAVPMSDADLQPIMNKNLLIEKILRTEGKYSVSDPETVYLVTSNGPAKSIEKTGFAGLVTEFAGELVKSKGAAFPSVIGNKLLSIFDLEGVKAASSQKEDIDLAIRDPKTSLETKAGFSIKSYLGNPSTLLNASKQNTNFRFRVDGLNGDIDKVNYIEGPSKVRDRIAAIHEAGGSFSFDGAKGEIFSRNLLKIDSLMPSILGCLTLANFMVTKRGKKITDLIASEELADLLTALPVHLDEELISYKVKSLLLDVALGMVPKKPWDGRQKADGGYIVVKDTGALVCFHVYNFGAFSDYLLGSTMFDTPSTSRHEFGFLYEEDGQCYFDVNCQIRFVR